MGVHVSYITMDGLPLCLCTLQSMRDHALVVCTKMFSLLFRTKRANIVYRVEDPVFSIFASAKCLTGWQDCCFRFGCNISFFPLNSGESCNIKASSQQPPCKHDCSSQTMPRIILHSARLTLPMPIEELIYMITFMPTSHVHYLATGV